MKAIGNLTKTKEFTAWPEHVLMTTEDLRQLMGVSTRTIYRWITDNELKPAYFSGKAYLFRKSQVAVWYKHHYPKRGRPWHQ